MICISGFVNANESKKPNRYIYMALGTGSSAVRDYAFSPLIYSGSNFNGQLSHLRFSEKRHKMFFLQGGYGVLKNSFERTLKLTQGQILTLDNFVISNKKNFCLGWSSSSHFNHKNSSVSANFNGRIHYATNFGISGFYHRSFKLLNRDWELEVPIYLQLIGFKIQPYFISSLPKGYHEQDVSILKGFFKSMELAHLFNTPEFGMLPNLTYYLKNGNGLILQYHLNYFSTQGSHLHTRVNGFWSFGLKTKL